MEEPFEEKPNDEQPDIVDGEVEEVDLSADEPAIDAASDPTIRQSFDPEAEETTLTSDEPTMDFSDQPTIKQSPVLPEYDPDEQATTARPSIYDDEKKSGPPILPLVLGGAAALCGIVLILGAIAMLVLPGARGGGKGSEELEFIATPTLERTLVFPTATVGPTETPVETEAVEEEETEAPDDEPTATNRPAATNPPAAQNPTNPPPPPPTNTPVPPPPASTIDGLTGVAFSVSNPTVGVNQRIDFTFSVTNSGDESIIFGPLGVAVQDANGTTLTFHTSWTRWELKPDKTENWTDGVAIGNPGSYRLELSACIPKNDDHCDVSGGDWHVLAPAVAVTVN